MNINEAQLVINNFKILNELNITDMKDVTKDYIKNKLTETLDNNKNKLDSQIKSKNELIEKLKTELNNANIDTDLIEENVQYEIKQNKKQIEQLLLNNNIEGLKKIYLKMLLNIKAKNKSAFGRAFESEDGEVVKGIFKAIGMFCFVFLASIFFTVIATVVVINLGFVGQAAFSIIIRLSIVIIGPMVEEFAKMKSIKGKYGKQFFILFNAIEFSQYVISLTSAGFPLLLAVVVRLIAIAMHFTTTMVHGYFAKRRDLRVSDKDKKMETLKGYTIGTLIHSIWNYIAIMNAF